MSKNSSLDHMLAADGELTSAEREALGPDAEATEASVRELGALVRGHLELAADEAEPRLAELWDLVERRLDREEEAPAETARGRAPAPVTWLAGLRGWFSRYRSHVATGLVSAGAVAGLSLALRPDPQAPATRATREPVVLTPAVHAPELRTPPEVESLEVQGGTGTVFTVEDEDGETAIIWVESDPVDPTEGI